MGFAPPPRPFPGGRSTPNPNRRILSRRRLNNTVTVDEGSGGGSSHSGSSSSDSGSSRKFSARNTWAAVRCSMMAPLRGPKAPHGRPKDSLADPVLGAVMSFRGSRGSLEEAHGGSLTLSLPPLEGLSASAGPRGLEVLDVPALPALLSEPPVGVGAPGEGPQEEAAEEELNEDERSQHEGGFPHQIIPGLPDELGFECLLRVHRGDHRSASEVSAEWHSAIRSEEFFPLRRERGCTEAWLFVLSCDRSDRVRWRALDVGSGRWQEVPQMPAESGITSYGMTCVSHRGLLYVIGGAEWFKPCKQQVWCFNPLSNKWRQLADLNEARCHSKSAVLGGKLYVIGGMGNEPGTALASVEVYDAEQDKWEYIERLPLGNDLEDAVVFNGELLVRHAGPGGEDAEGPSAVRLDAGGRRWELVETPVTRAWHGPSVVVDGQWFMLDQKGGMRLLRFDTAAKKWVLLGFFDPAAVGPSGLSWPCKLVGLGGSLYVVGKGLCTAIVDISKLAISSKDQTGILSATIIQGPAKRSDCVIGCAVLEC